MHNTYSLTHKHNNNNTPKTKKVERNQDMIRSAMRLVFALSKAPGIDSHPRFASLIDIASKTPALQAMWLEVSQEATHVLGRRTQTTDAV